MITRFTYEQPETMQELLKLLNEHGPAAKILAGGTDLAVGLRSGKNLPQVVIDLKRVEAIRADIFEQDGFLRIGARTVMTDIIADERVRRFFPALAESAAVVGSVQIRNRATLAGNICNASPAADTAPALLVYGAVAGIIGINGSRRVPLTEFFTGPGRTVLEQNDVVEFIDLPIPASKCGSAFGRITRRRGVDLATINLCCLVTSSGETLFAYGAVGPKPFLARGDAQASPRSDLRGSSDYRLAMLRVVSRRTLDIAIRRLGEST
jgi:CO/xanthine dehydrogenase FAD-binding subunit